MFAKCNLKYFQAITVNHPKLCREGWFTAAGGTPRDSATPASECFCRPNSRLLHLRILGTGKQIYVFLKSHS